MDIQADIGDDDAIAAKYTLLQIVGDRLLDEKIPNPHWNPDSCDICHLEQPAADLSSLRKGAREEICNTCHSRLASNKLLHTSNIRPRTDMLRRMPRDYRNSMRAQNIVCTTCHDMRSQCLPSRISEKKTNPDFVRGGIRKSRSDVCYLCHDQERHVRLNPHEQIDDEGNIRKPSCRLCHENIEALGSARGISDVDFHIKSDLRQMCLGCHPWTPHPGGKFRLFSDAKPPNHLIRPDRAMHERLVEISAERGVIMPLDPTNGKIFCATCHNPHEEGVVAGAAGVGATNKDRLRSTKICTICHDK
ncbi:hypothetical protein QVG61_05880 [Thiohalobacter sp. IOR34]|uniref:hypothetical protein n=1 Tax=Thiohalobacter sp. IOR34 TaxID=3057176 RepID=UPI0025AEDE22|nr:hypothetical protein [Thiohalobacter sp. IOR34]WJW76618.1 hypothetical protein QVG61_05880 [Thiohalobacter sp. IOR34]